METPGIGDMVGKVLTGIFEIEGYRFRALDRGPVFKFNPSVSFMLNFDPSRESNARKNLDLLRGKLSGGWIQDRYGVNWQLMTLYLSQQGCNLCGSAVVCRIILLFLHNKTLPGSSLITIHILKTQQDSCLLPSSSAGILLQVQEYRP